MNTNNTTSKGKKMKNGTTLRVSDNRKILLEKAAIEVSYLTGETLKWTELANYLFDHLIEKAKEEIIKEKKPDNGCMPDKLE
jgi:DNA-directed RNA polymerase subunit F